MQGGNHDQINGRETGWLKIAFLVIAWLIIASLIRDVWQIRMGFNRIIESEKRLVAEEAKNNDLKQKLKLVKTEEYQEKLIREKLNMQKEGEVLVVIPKKEVWKPETEVGEVRETTEANWEKWWNLVKW